MAWVVEFDLIESGFKSWGFSAFGLIFIVVGFFLAFFSDRVTELQSSITPFIKSNAFWYRAYRLFGWFFFLFAILWTVGSFYATYGEYARLRSAYLEGEYSIVEGYVEDFDPMPDGGHKTESFSVNGVKFEYSDFVVTAGFNSTASYGGPIREGIYIRIWYVNGAIIRLEVRK